MRKANPQVSTKNMQHRNARSEIDQWTEWAKQPKSKSPYRLPDGLPANTCNLTLVASVSSIISRDTWQIETVGHNYPNLSETDCFGTWSKEALHKAWTEWSDSADWQTSVETLGRVRKDQWHHYLKLSRIASAPDQKRPCTKPVLGKSMSQPQTRKQTCIQANMMGLVSRSGSPL